MDPAPRARLAAGLGRAEAALARLRVRLAPWPDPDGEPLHGPAYGEFWRPTDEDHARDLILLERDIDRFDAAGARQAKALLGHTVPDSVVLDLGCGLGRVARHVAPHVRELWAVDVSAEMLELARRHLAGLANVRFARCTGTAFAEVPDACVDLAYAVLVLQHVEREDAVLLLRELRRVLRPGGRAWVTFPNLLSDRYLGDFLGYVDRHEVANPTRARFYTPQEVERLVPTAGFAPPELSVDDEIGALLRHV